MPDHVDLRLRPVAHLSHLFQSDDCGSHCFDRHLAKLLQSAWARVDFNVVLCATHFCRSRRHDERLRAHCVDNLLSGQPSGFERHQIQINRHNPEASAVRPRNLCTGHRGERRADLVESRVVNLAFGKRGTGERILHHGNGSRIVSDDERGSLARRHQARHRLRDCCELSDSAVYRGAFVQEDFDDPDAVE